jgi:hypothetical protein
MRTRVGMNWTGNGGQSVVSGGFGKVLRTEVL